MFDTDAISQVLQNIKPNSVIIGQRVNLYSSRPFVKYISANLFRLLFFVTFKTTKIKDPHGLNSYPTKVFINALPFMKSHENHLVPLAFSIKNSLEIINIPIRVREQHKKENNRRGVPKFRDIIDSSHNLLLARKILKSSNSYT
jgi:hypothetical protein